MEILHCLSKQDILLSGITNQLSQKELDNEMDYLFFFKKKVDQRSAILHVFTKTPLTQRSYGSCKINRI